MTEDRGQKAEDRRTMEAKHKQSGITLMEMTVVIGAVALLAVLGLPAISAFVNSLASSGPTKAMISAALSSTRAIAIKERHYAGIRFQKAYDPKGPLEAVQYMVFIVHDFDKTGLKNGFRAVEGLEPIRLPDAVGIIDLDPIGNDTDVDEESEVVNATTFSIIFSPSGKLVIHKVRTRNRDGTTSDNSEDDIFNTDTNVEQNGIGMFIQDYSESSGDEPQQEPSRNSFVIYDRNEFKAAFEKGRAWSDYLQNLDAIYINPYVGTIIEK